MTIKDVAKVAGVSPAAVSRYLNGGSLSEKKREIIKKTIEETGYRPTVAAQMMRTGKQKQVGILVPKIYSDSVAQIVEGATEQLQEKGYVVVLGNTGSNEVKELDYMSLMEANQASGLIIMGTTVTPVREDAYRACKIPVIITGQNISGIPCVYHDDYNAAKDLMARILNKKRSNVAFIGVTDKDPQAGRARRMGVEDAFMKAGRKREDLLIEITDFDAKGGYEAMQKLLLRDPHIDGVMCATDSIALGAMRALFEAGRTPGKEVSIAGIGDSWTDTYSLIPLTTAHFFYRQCGEDAAQMLLSMIENVDNIDSIPSRQMCLEYKIIERGSI